MIEKRPILLLASAATLTLALNQSVWADAILSDSAVQAPTGDAPVAEAPPAQAPAIEIPVAAPAEAPATEAPATEPTSAELPAAEPTSAETPAAEPPVQTSPAATHFATARERMETRQAEMMEGRRLRYDELRARAAEVGLTLPEVPPWEQAGIQAPEMPAPSDMPAPPQMPSPPDMSQHLAPPASAGPKARAGKTPEEREAIREQRYQARRERAAQRGVELPETPPWKLMSQEERQAHQEIMRNMTPEERQAMREAHWNEMRERAQEQGIEMPELPPWKQAEQRRQEMQARWEKYRTLVDQMSEEQREAAEAVFGQAGRQPEGAPMQHPMQQPMSSRMPMQAPYGRDYGMPMRPPMVPGYGGQGTGPSMQDWGAGGPWSGGNQDWYQAPPLREGGYGQPW